MAGPKTSYAWRRGLVADTCLWNREVPGTSSGSARSMVNPWERLFKCVSSPHFSLKNQYPATVSVLE